MSAAEGHAAPGSAPFREPLRPEWIDEYGHMSEVYYLAAAGNAIWDLFERIGIGVAYHKATGCGLYAAESHVRYLREIRAPATLETTCVILAAEGKRIHYGAIIRVEGEERATAESVLVHVDTRSGRSTPLPEAPLRALQALQESEPPEWCGRGVSLRRR